MKFLGVLLAICATSQGHIPSLDGRIVGGQAVDISNFPYQVSIRYQDQHVCGGSIINANSILTAAHCVHKKNYLQFGVRLGNTVHDKGTYHKISQIIEHNDYNPIRFDNDMAILKLENSISFGPTAQPVPLQPLGVEVLAGTPAWVSGWGVLYEGSQISPKSLHAVDVNVITYKRCIDSYSSNEITSHMLCAQTLEHDSCQGDSGGPLVASGRLIGVISWGYGCARPLFPGVYAKVSDMNSWIVKNSE